jgi:hypothetical protein
MQPENQGFKKLPGVKGDRWELLVSAVPRAYSLSQASENA